MKTHRHRAKHHVPEPRVISMPKRGYQPSKAEQEEEINMPRLTEEQLRETFFRPFKFQREGSD